MKKNVKKAKMKIPFFAQILSKQELQLTSAGSKAYATAKSPSDKDETTLPILDTVNPDPGPTPPGPTV